MALTAGTRLGPYEILSALGAGGMGEVYRARDTKLNRHVAIKVLPDLFASDTERLARFTREAQTLGALNHPHIAQIYGLEESSGVRALVMELVEGEDLSQRISRGAIPLDDALSIAKQVAEALEAAHEQGIIHRDLKPANIKVRPDGTVKVLDFGLAKLATGDASDAEGSQNVTHAPTITSPAMMTGMGIILGTAAYMSPEQARGKPVDRRADIWAFGVVLFEMLTGARAFGGEDVSYTLANVLKSEPDWNALPAATPRSISTLLRRCLTKDPKRRLDSAAAVRLEIDDALTSPVSAPPNGGTIAPRVSPWRKLAAAAVVLIIAAAAGFGGWTLKRDRPGVVSRFAITLFDRALGNPNWHVLALSPDGTRLAYSASTGLYLRTLDRLEAVSLGSGGATTRNPFFSPDGQWIGYWQAGQLKKVSVNGGSPVTLAALAMAPFGATWATDNTIWLGQGSAGIWRVSGNGGTPESILSVNAGQRAHGPQLLPDGRTILFTLAGTDSWATAQIVVQPLDGGAPPTGITGGMDARYLPTGHIVYALRGTLFAASFDLASSTIRGAPMPLVEGLWQATSTGSAQFATSSSGTLAYVPAFGDVAAPRTLVLVDRQGREEAIAAPPRPYAYPRLSPDGTRLALDIADDNRDIWVWDFPRGTLTRLTSDPAIDRQPLWTPDGQRIIYSSERSGGASDLFWQAANGTGKAERLTDGNSPTYAHTMSPDGRHLVVRQTDQGEAPDLMILDVEADRTVASPSARFAKPRPLLKSAFAEFNAEISPNGRWLAYQSDSSGRFEVYVRPFPNVEDGQWPVSTGGGTEPLWARDGRELFYRAPTGAVMGVSIQPGPSWRAATPTEVIEAANYSLGARGEFSVLPYRTYDVSANGRFLMIKNSDTPIQINAPRIVVVQQWFEELMGLVPAK